MKSSFSAYLIENSITTLMLSEDLVSILNRFKDELASGHPTATTVEDGLDVVALMRVYQYLADKETGSIIGVNKMVGAGVTDAAAVNTLKQQLRNNNVVASEKKVVNSMFQSGEQDGYSELIQQIDRMLDFIKKVTS